MFNTYNESGERDRRCQPPGAAGGNRTMTTDERRSVGYRIRAARERQGWDRGELARRLGVHAGSVARWESGGAVPHAWTVRRIAEMAGTTSQWLTSGDGAEASTGEGAAGKGNGAKADPLTLEAMAP